jgi:hypothetical protein
VSVLTFAKASAALGKGGDVYAGRKLRRLVLAKERRLGIEIAVRGSGTKRPVRGVTLEAIRTYMPEIAPPPGPKPKEARALVIEQAREYLRDFDERVARTARGEAEAAIKELVDPQLLELRESNDEALKLCRDIAERLTGTVPKCG